MKCKKDCKQCRNLGIINKFILFPIIILLTISLINIVNNIPKPVKYMNAVEKDIRPELRVGLGTIKYYNIMLKINPVADRSTYVGTYSPITHNIEISLMNGNTKKTLCHELMHHKWFTIMSDDEKQEWYDKFNDLSEMQKSAYSNANEYHSYTLQNNYGECYNEKR